MIEHLLILDTETTGLDPKDHACIEVACCLYDVRHAAQITSFSSLIEHIGNAAEAINGISPELLTLARPREEVWPHVFALAQRADAIVAHRAEFDRGFVPARLRDEWPWICSKTEIEWTRGKLGEHLVHLALAHGVPVFTAHRAMADVDTLVRTFQAASRMTDAQAMLTRAMRPKTLMQAVVSYEERDKARAAGFSWDAPSRRWLRRMPLEDAATLPFQTIEVAS